MTPVVSRAELVEVLRPREVIQAIEEGFVAYSRGEVVVPPVGHLEFERPPGECHIKYGFIRGDGNFVIKIATGFFENPQRGLSSSNGVVLVWSSRTGELLAILQDEGMLTDLRTAAAGAAAAKYLAPSKIETIGVIGAGIQAALQLEYLKEVTPCRKALVWARSPERARAFRVEGFEIGIAGSPDELAEHSSLIVTATPSRSPHFRASSVHRGAHITALGADGPGKQELDPELFTHATVRAVDSRRQCAEYGDSSFAVRAGMIKPEHLIELGQIVMDRELGRKHDREITIADLTGVAVQDIQIAKLALRKLGLATD